MGILENKIAVIGGGSWATANIKMLSDNDTPKEIFWWMRDESAIKHLQKFKHNPNYLSSVEINVPPKNISFDLKSVIKKPDYVLLNVPAAFIKHALKDISPAEFEGKKIISAIKGMVPDNNQIIGEFLNQSYNIPFENLVVISGPCHAEEVALEKLSYLTIASGDPSLAEEVAGMINTRYIKTILSDDIYGTEFSSCIDIKCYSGIETIC